LYKFWKKRFAANISVSLPVCAKIYLSGKQLNYLKIEKEMSRMKKCGLLPNNFFSFS
jgi:hypothetical protein